MIPHRIIFALAAGFIACLHPGPGFPHLLFFSLIIFGLSYLIRPPYLKKP